MLSSWADTFIYSWYVMIPLVFCSIISIGIICERVYSLRFSEVVKPSVAQAIHDLRYGGKTTTLEQLSAGKDSALSRLVCACLMYTSWPKDENAEAVQSTARREVVRLERGLVFLEVATGIGPLLGLLGTILGLIRIFGSVSATDLATQGATIAQGIAEAMHCTVVGLVVAIPALIAHSLLARQIESLTTEMETLCNELLGKLYSEAETTEPTA